MRTDFVLRLSSEMIGMFKTFTAASRTIGARHLGNAARGPVGVSFIHYIYDFYLVQGFL